MLILLAIAAVNLASEVRAIPSGLCGVNKYNNTALGVYIVGGQVAVANSWPFLVSLQMTGHRCGGTIISEWYILTAAHCIAKMPLVSQWSVVVGKHNFAKREPNEKRYPVDRIIKHEGYAEHLSHMNDIALLKVAVKIAFNDDVQPACLNANLTSELVGNFGTVSGWGSSFEGGPTGTILQQVRVPIVTNEECQEMYSKEKIQPTMLCAGFKEGGRDACQGDSGGPMFIKTDNSARWFQVGIVSWGYGCAAPNQPGVYTRVSSYLSWIKTNTGGQVQ